MTLGEDFMTAQLMREYETIYVMRPELDDKEAKDLMMTKKALIEQLGGVNLKVTAMGRRKLQWETKKETRGVFVHHRFLGNPGIVKDFDRDMSIDDKVLIRQSVLLNKDVDASTATVEEDILTPPIFKERKEYSERRFKDSFDDMDRDFNKRSYDNVSDSDMDFNGDE
jgi:small subunit ribosomal protein S6